MKKFAISLIIVAIMLTACGSKPKRTPTPLPPTDTPVPPTPTPIARPPNGTYSTTITVEELTAAGMDDYTACENAGTFEFTLTGDRWEIIQDATPGCTVLNPKWGGSVMFLGERASFHDDEPFGCNGDYTYQWRLTGNTLRFSSVDDVECNQRVYFMSQHPWTKVK
jgi:hypothetical protein